ncbi:hypothetical protein [Stenotrophomonas bentonitica]
MKFRLDFSLFYSPTQPYGCVTGYLEMPSNPALGQLVQMMGEGEDGVQLALRVDAVLEADTDQPRTLMLEDHVADGFAEAEVLACHLERTHKFFVDVY